MSGPGQKKVLDAASVSIEATEHHGWSAYLISNGIAEVIVVPAIGRVMQFRMAGDEVGVFWENRLLDGQLPLASGGEWANFGGDKTWPAPQEDWEKLTGRSWPPPSVFDSLQLDATVQGTDLILKSPIDSYYGIRTLRHVALHPASAKLTIKTAYCKVLGDSVNVGVWIITQLRDPQMLFALAPEQVKSAPGWRQMQGGAPLDFQQHGRLISMRRDRARNSKIDAEGSSLLWIGDEYVLRIDHDSALGSTSIYTNMDPLQYVELETEGPVTEMRVGDKIELTNTYELTRRTTSDFLAEATRSFGLRDE